MGELRIHSDLVLGIDGAQPLSADSVALVQALCDQAEDRGREAVVTLRVSGVPDRAARAPRPDVGLVSKWERALRRLERLPVVTAALVFGDCGGPALDALLATDLRIATPGARLLVPVLGDATWPGMALYRLTRQAGAVQTRRAALLGLPIDAGEAMALGLVDRLSDDPADALERWPDPVPPGRELATRRLMSEAMSLES